jgi:hypothetical protein
MPSPKILRFITIATLASACGSDGGPCLAPPCPAPFAARVTVTSSASSAPVIGAFVHEVAPSASAQNLCNGDSCDVPGGPGTYQLDVGAPGFTTQHLTVTVTGTTQKCGCGTVDTKQLSVALVPAA